MRSPGASRSRESLLSDQILTAIRRPGEERLVYPRDRPVRESGQVSARSVLVELVGALFEQWSEGRDVADSAYACVSACRATPACVSARNAFIAATVCSGALRFGQWPLALQQHELTLGHLFVHVPADPCGAMTSSAHCRIERRRLDLRQVRAVVGEERHAREVLRDLRVGAAEAVRRARRPSSGRSGLPMITGAIALDQPR